jgi:hypothetical protein
MTCQDEQIRVQILEADLKKMRRQKEGTERSINL